MKMRSLGIPRVAVLGAIAAALVACGSDPANPADTNDVHTPGTVFSPPSLTIEQGEEVLFHIQGEDHNVDFDPVAGAPADIPTVGDTTVSRTFATVGTFPYACTVHANMTGEIVVQ